MLSTVIEAIAEQLSLSGEEIKTARQYMFFYTKTY